MLKCEEIKPVALAIQRVGHDACSTYLRVRKILKCSHECMVSVQKVEDGACWVLITYFDSTQFAVYNGVTHNSKNPSIVDLQ